MPQSFEELRRTLAAGSIVTSAVHVRPLLDEYDRLHQLLNNAEVESFLEGVRLEPAHQVERWGVDHDVGKEPMDWFWLIGYLAGKCLRAHLDGHRDKALHHTISTGAALANWHRHIKTGATRMQPGHAPSVVLAAENGDLVSQQVESA